MSKIKQLRKKAGWKTQMLAELAGLSVHIIRRAEKGLMSATTRLRLAKVFGVNVWELEGE